MHPEHTLTLEFYRDTESDALRSEGEALPRRGGASLRRAMALKAPPGTAAWTGSRHEVGRSQGFALKSRHFKSFWVDIRAWLGSLSSGNENRRSRRNPTPPR